MSHPTQRLDNSVHQRVRLGILTVLSEAGRADFAYLRDELGLTDGNLSRNLQVLEQEGYIAIEKTFVDRRPRTRLSATRAGKRALAGEIAVLSELIATVERSQRRRPAVALSPAPKATG